MAVITPDTFDPRQRFVSVRLQQGVPIVDADWNEKDDARRFEMRTYLKWYVGDGVPYGSDAFRIQALPAPAANNFIIRTGVPVAPVGTTPLSTGLHHVGRCLVDGLEAIIEDEDDLRGQPLHVASAGAAATALRLGTVTIPEMLVLDGTVLAYLDVWERLARPDEFPGLVFVDIGTESCVRIRREWAVRTRLGTIVPQDGDADFEAGHSYYALATIARVAADPVVFPSQVTDLREQRLLTPPATLIEDLLGATPDRYRRGLDRPAIPLRDAVNALLKGQLPSSADQVIAPDPANDFPSRAIARWNDETYLLWHSNRAAAVNQIFATTWTAADPTAVGLNPPVQVTSAAAAELPSLALLPTSPVPALFVAYQTQNDIRFRRAATPAGLPAAAETPVAAQAETEAHAVAIRTGQIVTVFWHWNGPLANDRIRYRRRLYDATWAEPAAAWLNGETSDLSALQARLPAPTPGLMHAAANSLDRVWVAFETAANTIAVARLTPATSAIETFVDIQLSVAGLNQQPFVLIDEPDRVFVFWRADGGIHEAIFDLGAATWGPATAVPGAGGPVGANSRPVAVRDAEGGIWLLWSRLEAGQTNIWAARRDPATGGWGLARQVTASAGSNDFAFAMMQGGSIHLFFRSNRTGEFALLTKQIVTTI